LSLASAAGHLFLFYIERQVVGTSGFRILELIGLFIVEMLLKRPVLAISDLAVIGGGMFFSVKAGMLFGRILRKRPFAALVFSRGGADGRCIPTTAR